MPLANGELLGYGYRNFLHLNGPDAAPAGPLPEVTFEGGVAKILANIDYWRNAPLWDPESIARATKTWFDYLTPHGNA